MKEIVIYTDGACSNNPGPGGWAAILTYKSHNKEISGGEAETTNNRMEMTAAIKALEALREPCVVKLYSDSAYLCDAFNKGWIFGWQKKNWNKSNKQPVLNRDLWERLIELSKMHKIEWIKVKGHSDVAGNNRCDELARDVIRKMTSA